MCNIQIYSKVYIQNRNQFILRRTHVPTRVCVCVCRLVENLNKINILQTADWETVVAAPRATPSPPERIIDFGTFFFFSRKKSLNFN